MTIRVAKLTSLGVLIGAACVGLAGCAAREDGAAQESVTTRTSAIVTSDPRCADGTVDQTFSGGIVGCAGGVTWDRRRDLCGGGYRPVTAAEWVANAGGGPTHHYWTDDHLNYSGTPDACWVSLTGGSDCGDTPMRVCKSSQFDPEGNKCNWRDCGLDSAVPDRFFGGCNGNSTAGTLCIPSACADGTVEQTFTGGLVGCAGKVTWDNRRVLCAAGYRPATAAEWVALGGVAPQHDYWTDDDLHWNGIGRPGACYASVTGGGALPSGTPMRVCTFSGSDPEGNACTYFGCGFENRLPNMFFGGCVNDTTCANNTTAGTLCVPEGCADGSVEQVFPNGMVGCAGIAATAAAAAPLCAPGYRLVSQAEYDAIAHPEIRSSFTVSPDRAYWTQTTRRCPIGGCAVTTGGALCVPQRGCADGTTEQVMPDGFVGCGGAVSWANRDSLCGRGYRTATAEEWKTLNSFSVQIAPTHDYWTADPLKANVTSSSCWASTCTGTTCGSGDQPMRLCTSSGNDLEGNTCTLTNCGIQTTCGINTITLNRYFGGCDSTTAGALCVPDIPAANVVNQEPRVMDMINSALSAYPETPAMAIAVIVEDKIFLGARGKRKATDTTETLQVTDKFQQNSVSKTISGTVSSRVVDQGSLSWDTTLGEKLPSIFPGPYPDYANVTLAELHAHASGFDVDSTANSCQQPGGLTFGCQPSPPPDAKFDYNFPSYPTVERKRLFTRDYTRDYPLFAHGTGHMYGGGAVAGISMVEQTLSQTPYDFLLEDFIFRPLMMKHSGTTPDVFGHTITDAGGGIFTVGAPHEPEVAANKTKLPLGGNATSIEDLARYARATLYSPRDPVHFWSYQMQQSRLNNVGLSPVSPSGWSLSVLNHAGGLQLYHNGGEGWNYSWIAVWPERRVAIAAMTNCSGTRALDSISNQAVSGSLFALFGVPSASFPHQDAPSYRATSGLSSSDKPGEDANKAFDGNYDTDWSAEDSNTSGAWLKVTVPQQAFVGHVLVNENGPFDKMTLDPDLGAVPIFSRDGGRKVAAFRITSWQLYLLDSAGAEWLAATGTTLGANKLIPVNGYNVTGAKLVMSTNSPFAGGPTIKEMHLLPW